MRLAYISTNPAMSVFGQSCEARNSQALIEALVQLGVEVDLYTPSPTDGRVVWTLPGNVYPLPVPEDISDAARELAAIASNAHLAALLRRNGPYDVVYERHYLWSYSPMQYALSARIPGLLEVNTPLLHEAMACNRVIHREHAETISSRAFLAAAAVLTSSGRTAAHLMDKGIAPTRLHVTPPCVDLTSEYHRNEHESDPFTVGYVGPLEMRYGAIDAIHSFDSFARYVPTSRMTMCGGGHERRKLESIAQQRGLAGRVSIMDLPTDENLPDLLSTMNVAVLPFTPRACVYEVPREVYGCLAAGLPIVCTRCEGMEQLVEHGVNGFLVRPGDQEAIACAVHRLYQDSRLRARTGEASRNVAERRFTWKRAAERVLEIARHEAPRTSSHYGYGCRVNHAPASADVGHAL